MSHLILYLDIIFRFKNQCFFNNINSAEKTVLNLGREHYIEGSSDFQGRGHYSVEDKAFGGCWEGLSQVCEFI